MVLGFAWNWARFNPRWDSVGWAWCASQPSSIDNAFVAKISDDRGYVSRCGGSGFAARVQSGDFKDLSTLSCSLSDRIVLSRMRLFASYACVAPWRLIAGMGDESAYGNAASVFNVWVDLGGAFLDQG
jgi:hypothetical protein